jgi:TolB-like protein
MLAFAAPAAHAQARIDDAVRNTAESLSAGFGDGARIAVVSMEAGSRAMSDYLINGMIDTLVGMGRFTVVSRGEVELAAVRDELDFNMSGYVDDHSAQFIGRFLGAQFIVAGVFESTGDGFRLRVRVIEVETAVIRATHSEGVRGDRAVRYLLGDADPARLWSLGAAVGTSFARPWLVGTLQGTVAPFSGSLLRVGIDFGTLSGDDRFDYLSVFPFAHLALFVPFEGRALPFSGGGWHIGAGGGLHIGQRRFATFAQDEGPDFMLEIMTGLIVADSLDISYSLRTDFSRIMHKVSVGFVYRFL